MKQKLSFGDFDNEEEEIDESMLHHIKKFIEILIKFYIKLKT